ncbi:hypothetical protein HP567_019770 [Brevibacillus sp. M2.1A]|uniref:hypothetical protein n=1 Tax=Brevibacillus TaxID=55080 RepID=UPI00156AE47C|nr:MULTISPECIES: hypothetical protein [Brevibacillus]MBY0088664.1 hypothetical protein [Brevibacillus brevis]MCC8436789.1 hypothetical protein [Brevibacillus sp. M2.1A]UKK98963.1 hypothetical protein FO446_16720 [Brevibacillus brevis]
MTLLKKFSFWLTLVSILICLFDFLGNDEKHILLSITNPILNEIVYIEPFKHWIIEVHQDANSTILPTGYLLHVITYFLFGLLIDLALTFRKKQLQNN